jgi:hypothetical protein
MCVKGQLHGMEEHDDDSTTTTVVIVPVNDGSTTTSSDRAGGRAARAPPPSRSSSSQLTSSVEAPACRRPWEIWCGGVVEWQTDDGGVRSRLRIFFIIKN